jgi:hypothetical protein
MRTALSVGMSLAVLPVVLLWTSATGLRWGQAGAVVIFGLIAAGLVWMYWSEIRRFGLPRPDGLDLALAAALIVTLGVRLVMARDLALPPWVDSPHHALLARVLAEAGQAPADYGSLLPVGSFTYHFGFHAVAVTLDWLSPADLAEAMLIGGQALNALMVLAGYTFVAELTGRRGAGLWAAAFVGCVSYFPGYYLSWGRYTQLAGLLVLAPALAATWRVLAGQPATEPGGTTRTPARAVLVASVLAAGLFLAHYRVFLFFAVFALVAGLAHVDRWRGWRWWLAAAALAGLLVLPWARQLWADGLRPALATPGGLGVTASYNEFPVQYFQSGLERGWMVLAGLALAAGAARRNRPVLVVGVWAGLLLALLNTLPPFWLLNNNTWAISLFVPGALPLGWGLDGLAGWAAATWRQPAVAQRALGLGAGLALAGLAGYAAIAGLAAQVGVLNPATVLAAAADREALDWARANTPPEAYFAVNGWAWQLDLWAAADGGAWLLPLAGRQSTLPPVDYAFGADPWRGEVEQLNRALAGMEGLSAEARLALLRRAGVTHVFIGQRGGPLRPEMFANSPDYELLFSNGAAWIFALRGE